MSWFGIGIPWGNEKERRTKIKLKTLSGNQTIPSSRKNVLPPHFFSENTPGMVWAMQLTAFHSPREDVLSQGGSFSKCPLSIRSVIRHSFLETVQIDVNKTFSFASELSEGFPGGSDGKESASNAENQAGFNLQVGKIPWRRAWQPTPVFLPGEFHGQRSLVGYSPWGLKESDMTEPLILSLSFT